LILLAVGEVKHQSDALKRWTLVMSVETRMPRTKRCSASQASPPWMGRSRVDIFSSEALARADLLKPLLKVTTWCVKPGLRLTQSQLLTVEIAFHGCFYLARATGCRRNS
jgi:hypothetical protein